MHSGIQRGTQWLPLWSPFIPLRILKTTGYHSNQVANRHTLLLHRMLVDSLLYLLVACQTLCQKVLRNWVSKGHGDCVDRNNNQALWYARQLPLMEPYSRAYFNPIPYM